MIIVIVLVVVWAVVLLLVVSLCVAAAHGDAVAGASAEPDPPIAEAPRGPPGHQTRWIRDRPARIATDLMRVARTHEVVSLDELFAAAPYAGTGEVCAWVADALASGMLEEVAGSRPSVRLLRLRQRACVAGTR